jgi:uncharacterized membrane protein
MASEPAIIPVDDKKEKQVDVSVSREVSGPLPSASEFAGYEQTLPGSANRILACMENELVFLP